MINVWLFAKKGILFKKSFATWFSLCSRSGSQVPRLGQSICRNTHNLRGIAAATFCRRRFCLPQIHVQPFLQTTCRFGHVDGVAVASNGSKEDGGPLEPYTLDLLGLVPDRSLPLSLSLSSRAIGREKEREGRRPWEARAICIPNDRMTFARCIKMPLIDGARENTFVGLVSSLLLDKAESSAPPFGGPPRRR